VAKEEGPEPSEAELVSAALAGDVRAFEALLARNERKVLRVLRLLGVPAQDRDDVAQEAFLRAFRHLDGFRPGRPFGAWIYRVAVNAAHDHLASAARRRRDEAPWDPGLEERAVKRTRGIDLASRLEAALEALTERERAVFVLLELEGLDTLEVARALGITRITVRRHLGLARARLRAILEGGGPGTKSDSD